MHVYQHGSPVYSLLYANFIGVSCSGGATEYVAAYPAKPTARNTSS